MPPKKKARTTRSCDDVPAVQSTLDQWLQSVYGLRHNGEDAVATHPWPVEHGGTFLDIAGCAWEDEDRLVTAAHRLCQKAGVVDPDLSVDSFKDEFIKMQAGWAMPTMFKRVSGGMTHEYMVSEYHYYGNNWSCLTTHRAIQLAIGHLNPMIISGVATSTGQDDSDQHSAVEHGARGILARLRAYE